MIKYKFPYFTIAILFFSMLPVTMIVPVFKDIIKDRLGGDNLMVSYFMSVAMLGSFLFSPIAGYLSDKFKTRKWFIGIFAILDGISFILLSITTDLEVLQLVRFFEGICHIFVIGLLLALLADRENDESNEKFFRKGIVLGIGGMFLSLGVGLGSPLGVLGKKNPLVPFYVASAIMIAIGILTMFFLKDYEYYHEKKVTLGNWIQALKEKPLVLVPSMFNFIDRFTVGFFVTSFNLHFREELQLSAGMVGVLLSLVLLPMSLFSYPFAILARKTGPFPLMLIGSLIYGICMGIAGYIQITTFLIPVLLFCGIGAGVMFVPSMMMVIRLSPKNLNASVISGFTGFGSIGFMLGPICSVLLQNYLKEQFVGWNSFGLTACIFGGLEVLIVLFTLPLYKKMQES
ncbi:MAG: MFS transporter [Leptospiraceae bacterium]|nr:MFS transporter [Leptospiraceae bacterium]